jgi:hypothetical protein
MFLSALIFLCAHADRQTFHAFYYTALATDQRFIANVTRVPGSATQFSFADRIQVNLFGCDGGFPNQAVNVVPMFSLRHSQKPFTKQPEGKDRENRKQDDLKPYRARGIQACKYADDNGSDSEKDNIEATRREQFRQKKKKAYKYPNPPFHNFGLNCGCRE